MSIFTLKLFVTGKTTHSEQIIATLQRLCKEEFLGQYKVIIIDVTVHSQLAKQEMMFAISTLVNKLPPPLRYVIEVLADQDQVLLGLDLLPRPNLPAHAQSGLRV